MKRAIVAGTLAALTAISMVWTAPAHADVDTEFADALHGYGIYGQRDFNAWLAKITCKRLTTGVDADASASAVFLSRNLAPGSSTEQIWQFLGAAIPRYCPPHTPALIVMAQEEV